MDPNAAWKQLGEAYTDPDADPKQIATSLVEWLNRGGFPPLVTGNTTFDAFVCRNVCLEILGTPDDCDGFDDIA